LKIDGIAVRCKGFMPLKRLSCDVRHIHQVTPPGVASAREFPAVNAHFGHYQGGSFPAQKTPWVRISLFDYVSALISARIWAILAFRASSSACLA
jgi:hypothetical protein